MYFKDEEEYQEYLEKNEIMEVASQIHEYENNFFRFSEEGDILLDQSKCKKSMKNIDSYSSCLGWIMLDDGKTMALLKNSFGDVYRSLSIDEYYIALYNNILMPQIAKQLQNQSATYYFAKRSAKKSPKNNTRYVLTLDFKNKDEELIHGSDILKEESYDATELRMQKLVEILEDYLIEKGFNMQDIERTRIDFIRQAFFQKFIKQLDEHNENWGVLVDRENNSVRNGSSV